MVYKVLMISRNSIFRAGVEALLASDPELAVKVADITKELIQITREYQPNLLLIQNEEAPYSQQEVNDIARAIETIDQCRVLSVERDSNLVSIYDKSVINITKMKDLLILIKQSSTV